MNVLSEILELNQIIHLKPTNQIKQTRRRDTVKTNRNIRIIKDTYFMAL